MSASSFQLTAVHEWCAHDPFGKLKPADVSAALLSVTDNSGTVRLRAARNGYVSFRILIQGTGEYRLNASIGKNLETDLFKAWYHRMADQKEKQPDYWPDALIPVHGTEANGAIPDPDNKINGQSVQEYWVDLFVPPDAKPGTITGKIELITGGQTIKLPVAVEVLEHIDGHAGFFHEVARILKPGGLFLFTTPNILSLKSRIQFLFTGSFYSFGLLEPFTDDPIHQHISPFTMNRYAWMLSQHGLSIHRVATDKVQTSSLLLSLLVPFIRLASLGQGRNTGLFQKQNSWLLLSGRKLVIVARKAL